MPDSESTGATDRLAEAIKGYREFGLRCAELGDEAGETHDFVLSDDLVPAIRAALDALQQEPDEGWHECAVLKIRQIERLRSYVGPPFEENPNTEAVVEAAIAKLAGNPGPLTPDPDDEHMYRVKVEGGGVFLYDLIDVGRFAKEMAQQDDCRSFSVRRVTVDREGRAEVMEAQADLQTALGFYRLEHGRGDRIEDRLTKALARLHTLLADMGTEMFDPATHPEVRAPAISPEHQALIEANRG